MENKKKSAFTLIELMIVIAIISLISIIAKPGLKKAYEDFQIKQTVELTDALMKCYRSYYLIFNEFPKDVKGNYIPGKVACIFPSNYFKKSKSYDSNSTNSSYNYQLTKIPYGSPYFDFDNWIFYDKAPTSECMLLSITEFPTELTDLTSTYLNIFIAKYPCKPLPYLLDNAIRIPFPEFPSKSELDSKCENRYY